MSMQPLLTHMFCMCGIIGIKCRGTCSLKCCGCHQKGHMSVFSFIAYFVLWPVHTLFQSEFSTECDLVLPLSVSSIFGFLQVIQQLLMSSSSSSSNFYPSFYRSFNNIQKAVSVQDVTNPVSLLLFIVCKIFLYFLTQSNTSYFTQLVPQIFSILLQYHFSVLPKYFWCVF